MLNKENLILHYSRSRSLYYLLQYRLLQLTASGLKVDEKFKKKLLEVLPQVKSSLDDLLKADAQRIRRGVYPLSVLKPEPLIQHWKRYPKLFKEFFKTNLSRKSKATKKFSKAAEKYLKGLPAYYVQNFHFQSDGYLSKSSASLYDHEVEILFTGGGDAMRRLMISPLKKHLKAQTGPLKLLEIAAGTGRSSEFVKMALPQAHITLTDLSAPYLQFAKERYQQIEDFEYVMTDASDLIFKDEQFDAVFCSFLFHEMPPAAREKVFHEVFRVLRPGGLFVTIDTIQKHDCPEFNFLLEDFPKRYHEPFYSSYIDSKVDDLFNKGQFKAVNHEIGHFSKASWGHKV